MELQYFDTNEYFFQEMMVPKENNEFKNRENVILVGVIIF